MLPTARQRPQLPRRPRCTCPPRPCTCSRQPRLSSRRACRRQARWQARWQARALATGSAPGQLKCGLWLAELHVASQLQLLLRRPKLIPRLKEAHPPLQHRHPRLQLLPCLLRILPALGAGRRADILLGKRRQGGRQCSKP